MNWKILSGTMLIALAAPLCAQAQCAKPTAPVIPDGAKATPAQITLAQNDIKSFAAESDKFQACIAQEIGRQKDVAKQTNVEFDPAIQSSLEGLAVAQRNDVQRVAAAWGVSVQAFNEAQKRKPSAGTRTPPPTMGGYGSAYGGGGKY